MPLHAEELRSVPLLKSLGGLPEQAEAHRTSPPLVRQRPAEREYVADQCGVGLDPGSADDRRHVERPAEDAEFERRALADLSRYSGILAVLSFTIVAARWRNRAGHSESVEVQFEEEVPPVIIGLDLGMPVNQVN